MRSCCRGNSVSASQSPALEATQPPHQALRTSCVQNHLFFSWTQTDEKFGRFSEQMTYLSWVQVQKFKSFLQDQRVKHLVPEVEIHHLVLESWLRGSRFITSNRKKLQSGAWCHGALILAYRSCLSVHKLWSPSVSTDSSSCSSVRTVRHSQTS